VIPENRYILSGQDPNNNLIIKTPKDEEGGFDPRFIDGYSYTVSPDQVAGEYTWIPKLMCSRIGCNRSVYHSDSAMYVKVDDEGLTPHGQRRNRPPSAPLPGVSLKIPRCKEHSKNHVVIKMPGKLRAGERLKWGGNGSAKLIWWPDDMQESIHDRNGFIHVEEHHKANHPYWMKL
jgi:hypothetical protein